MSEQVVHLEYNEFVMFCMWYFKRFDCKLRFEFNQTSSPKIFKIDGNWIFEYNETKSMIVWSALSNHKEMYNKYLEAEDII